MHTWDVLAFLCFAAAAIIQAGTGNWRIAGALVAAGLALSLVPAVFELSS